jgi:hypothetical protein
MLTLLWWIGDAFLILAVFPILMLLLLRIIRSLKVAHRALVSISNSARSVTHSLPSGVTEISAAAQTADELRPSA